MVLQGSMRYVWQRKIGDAGAGKGRRAGLNRMPLFTLLAWRILDPPDWPGDQKSPASFLFRASTLTRGLRFDIGAVRAQHLADLGGRRALGDALDELRQLVP